jgi:hypothetical protein
LRSPRTTRVADGATMGLLDDNLNTDDRQDLQQASVRALSAPNVDLMRDIELKDARENDCLLEFQDHSAQVRGIALILASKPI